MVLLSKAVSFAVMELQNRTRFPVLVLCFVLFFYFIVHSGMASSFDLFETQSGDI